jgi:membrane dipeptidase
VSHLSDGGFWDVAKYSRKPLVASHSNARAIANNRRNLTDQMIHALADSGGIIGINFFGKFLENKTSGSISGIIAQMKHIRKVGGIQCLALGSDFDGFDGGCELKDASEYRKLIFALERNGFPSEEIEKITWKNTLRVMRETL